MELTDPNYLSSGFSRETVQLKILRIAGGVSGFQQTVSSKFINALQSEISGAVEGFSEALEWALVHGNKNDAYQFDGLEALMLADATAKKSIATGGNFLDVDGVIALSNLDTMIDATSGYRDAVRDKKAFLMTPQMISKVSGLQTRVSRDVATMEFEGGFVMSTYRGIPLVPYTNLAPASTSTSPTLSAAAAAGGSLPAATYYYVIASVTAAGEQIASAEVSATSASTNNTIDLTWTADATALQYRIYRGTSTGADNLSLLKVIAAKTYTASGALNSTVAAFSDNGTLTPVTAVKPLASGEQNIVLVDLDATRGLQMVGMVSPLGEQTDSFISYIPLATRKSAYEFMIEGFMAPIAPYATLHTIARRCKLA